MDDILTESLQIHRKAEMLLRDFRIVELWESMGAEVRFVGSFRSNLMMDKDIDLHVYTGELDAAGTLAALAPLFGDPRVQRSTFIDGAATDEHCLEWHLALKDDDGETWTLDMIQILAGSALDGFFEETAEAVRRAVTPEMRLAILKLKKAASAGNTICGIEFYKAVIEDHVQTWEEFLNWRKSNPVGSLFYWRPKENCHGGWSGADEEREPEYPVSRIPCEIFSLREHPEMLECFIGYFSSRWGREVLYRDCMTASVETDSPLPQWFLAVSPEGEIAGGAGLIPNDFISRMDLVPWLCALHVEESCRHRGLAGEIIQYASACAEFLGYRNLYCCTDHTGFYERYGFEFIGTGYHPWDETSRIYRRSL